MTTRLWTALLMLAAVFALHGLQCTAGSTDSAAGHTAGHVAASPAGHGDVAAMTAEAAPVGLGSAGMSAIGEHSSGHPSVVAAVVAAATDTEHRGAPHDAAGHLWTVCLAVLAAGLAVLLALVAPRLLRLTRPAAALTWLRPHPGPALLRPPDLFALCVLRT